MPRAGCCYQRKMIVKDEGYVLNARKYGEKALIVTLLTKSNSEGAGKKNRGLFQPGNKLFFEASARLEENMRRLLFCIIKN